MLQPENQSKKYQHLFTGIDSGQIKIPKFQRDFVWYKEQTAKLIDSIIKGFPIGTFILWKTREELRHIKNIGNAELPEPPSGDAVFYVLDGQQRITSLYAVQKGLVITKEGKEIDYKDINIDLSSDPDEDEQIVFIDSKSDLNSISVHKLLNGNITDFVKEYPDKETLRKIDTFRNRLTGYDFSTIVITEYPLDIACEIFTRINTGGTELSLFEIMVAKTYDEEKNFDLACEYDWLIDNNGVEKDLEDAGYDTIPAATVLQCIAAHISQQLKRKDILKLAKNDIIDSWPVVKNGIFSAVDYLRTHLRIPVSRLLPYNALLVPLTYFFIRNGGDAPSAKQNKLILQYFWWASLSQRFSSGVEGKLALDLKKMDNILNEQQPSYRGEEINLDINNLKYYWFSTGDAFCKAILCLYAYFEPKSFQNNSLVKIDNSWLKVAFSKNYHHFFPKAYLKKKGLPDWQANVILNITIVDDYLNKKKIGVKSPGDYLKNFSKHNPELDETMKTHLIKNINTYGIWEDDYEKFLNKRGERVISELNKRLSPVI
jgi:hypothetical protein